MKPGKTTHTGIALMSLAFLLSPGCSTDERVCKPLELEFEIVAKESPRSGRQWDRGVKEARPPDPTGRVIVSTAGKHYVESISQRRNTYSFRGRFYGKRGVVLAPGSTIKVELKDKDLAGAEAIGEISYNVTSANSGSMTSSNGAFKVSYTCRV